MIAVDIAQPGAPDVLQITEQPMPEPGPEDLLIRVVAAGVNRADLLQRQGLYPAPAGAPRWPGLEVAGVVEQVGASVADWKAGQPVCALLPGGGYAEYVTVDQGLALPPPPGIPLRDAAALVEAACTVWSTLEAAGARRGQTILIHGGAGGIGTFAVQYAAATGMRVIATAGSEERSAACRELGAEIALDYREADWVGAVAEAGGADVILDVVGAAYLDRNLEALAIGGTLAIIGLHGGRTGELNLGALLAKRARVLGTTLRSRPLHERAAIVAAVRRDVWPLVPDRVRPVVGARLSLREAARAHALMEAGVVVGKILLEP